MRILILSPFRRVAGGAQTYLRVLIPKLREKGHDVLYVWERDMPDSKEEPIAESCGVRGVSLNDTDARAAFEPDVVYSHGLKSFESEQNFASKYPTVLFAHDFFATCVSGTKRWQDKPGQPCERKLSLRCMVDYLPHGCGGRSLITAWGLYKQAKGSNRSLRSFRKILVASQFMRGEYARHTTTPVEVLPYPVTIEGPTQATAPRVVGGDIDILFLSRLTTLKGGADLIQALAILQKQKSRRYLLHVAGTGPETENLRRQAADSRVKTVFHGWIAGEKRAQLMDHSHLVALPSLWPEPFGLSGVEAGCLGIPAVGYSFGGIPDWLRPGQNGELARPGPDGAKSLSVAIEAIIADQVRYDRYSAGAREVAKEYDLDTHVTKLVRILEEARR